MRIVFQGHPVRATGSESAGVPRVSRCPPDAEPDTVLSFLTQELREVIEKSWTSTEHDKRLGIGWIFPDTPETGLQAAAELRVHSVHRVARRVGVRFLMSDPLHHDTLVFVTAIHQSLRHAFRKVSPRRLERKRA